MGKPIHKNKPTKNLDELLEHLHKPGDDLDAFEQEALEGFASLESTQEALKMKQRLDERMEEKFSEKRKPLFIYWSAAAGVALIIGLIFLVRTNGDLKEESLADNTVVNEKQITSDGIINPPPSLEKQEVGKKISNLSGKGHSEGESNTMGGYTNGPIRTLTEDSKSTDAELAMADESPSELSEKDKAKGDKDESDAKRSDIAKPVDDLAKNQNQTPVTTAAAGSGSDANSEKSKAREEEYKEPKATEYFTSRKIKKEKKVSETDTKPKSEINGTFENSNIKTAGLTIKESDLQQKIDKFFKDKDYKKSFICTLTVDADDIVESVVFQNPDIFSKSQRKELTEFLLKLKCFKNHEYSVYSTYLLNYKAP